MYLILEVRQKIAETSVLRVYQNFSSCSFGAFKQSLEKKPFLWIAVSLLLLRSMFALILLPENLWFVVKMLKYIAICWS